MDFSCHGCVEKMASVTLKLLSEIENNSYDKQLEMQGDYDSPWKK